MAWLPAGGAVDLFTPFTADGPDGGPVTIDSLHTLRRIEREAERRTADGVGQPMVFRAWSQNRSNQDQNVFGPPPTPQVRPRNARGIPYVIRRASGAPDGG